MKSSNSSAELVQGRGASAIPLADRAVPIPLSPAQQAIWLHEQFSSARSIYNQYKAVRIQGPLDAAALRRAFSEIVRRQEVLRTSVFLADGVPCQRIQPAGDVELPIIDLGSMAATDQPQEIDRIILSETARPFDFERDRLFRTLLVRCNDRLHVLIWIMHHLVLDGGSNALLRRELSALYRSFLGHETPPLPSLPVQYADYAQWQRRRLDGGLSDRLWQYWKAQLEGVPELLDLPTDRPRPETRSFRGQRFPFEFSADLSSLIRSVARELRVTPFLVLLSAWQIVLYRYSGQAQFSVGVPVSSRSHPDLAANLGLFINIIPIPVHFVGSTPWSAHLQQVRDQFFGALDNQELPFEWLIERCAPQRSPSHAPLVQVLFNLLPNANAALQLEGAEVDDLTRFGEACRFDLECNLQSTTDGFVGTCIYDTDLWNQATVRRMIGHFQAVLECVVADPGAPVDQIPMLTADERRQLMNWGQGVTALSDRSVVGQFARQAQSRPDATAVLFAGERWTYRQLDERSSQLARELQAAGVEREVSVGIQLERSAWMLVCVLAVWKAGGAFVPLDPSLPRLRLENMARESRLKVLLTQSNLDVAATETPARVILVDAEWPLISRHSAGPLDIAYRPQDLAYTMFTSGSTGRPKGVQIVQAAVVNFLESMLREPGCTRDDTLLAVTTLSFDISILELLLPLWAGGTVAVAPREACVDGRKLQDLLRGTNATVFQATPAAWRILLESGWTGDRHLKALCGGEALSRDLAAAMLDRVGSLWNMYGPTETTVWSLIQRVTCVGEFNLIGRPILNTQIYVLDSHREPVPIGVSGELYIGGEGLARGYLEQPALTSERFCECDVIPAGRLYRTGDRVRWRDDGRLEFQGRLDQQIKLRGFRIEPGEIETVLREHSAVAAAVVLLTGEPPGHQQLTAYVVAAPGTTAVADLRGLLKRRLPEYMMPSEIIRLDRLPMTASGKVDRQALPRPEGGSRHDGVEFATPRTPDEELLTRVCRQVLNVDRVGIHDNFFDLGGHSLLAIRLVDQVNRESNGNLSVTDVFVNPTLADLARSLRRPAPSAASSVPNRYLAKVRDGRGDATFVAVGMNLRALVEYLPSDLPIWWLKIDGLHVWPHHNLDIPAHAAAHLAELTAAIPPGKLILFGYSYGGALAFEMALQLCEMAGRELELVLLEPQWPWRRSQFRAYRWKRHLQAMSQLPNPDRLSYLMGRVRSTASQKLNRFRIGLKRSLGGENSARDRWEHIAPFFARNVGKYAPRKSLPIDVHLIGTAAYLDASRDHWQRLIAGSVKSYPMPDDLRHQDFSLPKHGNLWMTVIRELIASTGK